MSDATDRDLLRSFILQRSELAFAELVRRHMDLVYSAALRQLGGRRHLAEDVAQQVFTRLAQKARSLINHPALLGWLYLTASHTARRAVRGEWRREGRQQIAVALGNPYESSTDLNWERVRPMLDEAMKELKADDRDVLLQRYFAQRTFSEIGTPLKISQDGARRKVEHAVEKLHTLLARRGITSSAAALAECLEIEAVTAAPKELASRICSVAFHAPAQGFLLNLVQLPQVSIGLGLAACVASGLYVFESKSNRARPQAADQIQTEGRAPSGQAKPLAMGEALQPSSTASPNRLPTVPKQSGVAAAVTARVGTSRVQSLKLADMDIQNVLMAYQVYAGKHVVIEPPVDRLKRVVSLQLGPCAFAEAAKAISDALLRQDHIALDLGPDGAVHAHLVPVISSDAYPVIVVDAKHSLGGNPYRIAAAPGIHIDARSFDFRKLNSAEGPSLVQVVFGPGKIFNLKESVPAWDFVIDASTTVPRDNGIFPGFVKGQRALILIGDPIPGQQTVGIQAAWQAIIEVQ